MRKPTLWFCTLSDINEDVQLKKGGLEISCLEIRGSVLSM